MAEHPYNPLSLPKQATNQKETPERPARRTVTDEDLCADRTAVRTPLDHMNERACRAEEEFIMTGRSLAPGDAPKPENEVRPPIYTPPPVKRAVVSVDGREVLKHEHDHRDEEGPGWRK